MRAMVPVFGLALALVPLSRASNQPADTVNAPAVIAARTRQELVKTLAITFRRTEVVARGGVSGPRPGYTPWRLLPDRDTTLESTNRLVIDGEKIRYEDNHPIPHWPTGKLYPRESVGVFNGSRAFQFYPKGLTGDRSPAVLIGTDTRSLPIFMRIMVPITAAFRGLDPAFSAYLIGNLEPTGVEVSIDGSVCQEYLLIYSGSLTFRYWLDPSKDYVLRRIRSPAQGQPATQMDIRYQREETVGWVPASWTSIHYTQDGAVRSTDRVEVLTIHVNDPQPAEQFDIPFPPGTLVTDRLSDKQEKNYRVNADGSLRELGVGGQELPSAQPKDARPLVGLGVVFLAVLGAYAWRMARKRRGRNAG